MAVTSLFWCSLDVTREWLPLGSSTVAVTVTIPRPLAKPMCFSSADIASLVIAPSWNYRQTKFNFYTYVSLVSWLCPLKWTPVTALKGLHDFKVILVLCLCTDSSITYNGLKESLSAENESTLQCRLLLVHCMCWILAPIMCANPMRLDASLSLSLAAGIWPTFFTRTTSLS